MQINERVTHASVYPSVNIDTPTPSPDLKPCGLQLLHARRGRGVLELFT